MANGKGKCFDMLVVGAGFAGLYQLYRAREKGLSVRVLEAGDSVGGTWFWNRYPGARCDVESLDYSYSFSKELEQEWVWSERYAPQAEILRYINHVADRFDLRGDIQLNTRVASATFEEVSATWVLKTQAGEVFESKYVVMATGGLSVAQKPDLKNLTAFTGKWYHSAEWPREGVDFTGKRVALIGTGSSGVQMVPVIAEQAKQLTVFQRTANYSVPAQNEPLTPEMLAQAKAHYPERRAGTRGCLGAVPQCQSQRRAGSRRRRTQSRTGVSLEERGRRFSHAAGLLGHDGRSAGKPLCGGLRTFEDSRDRQGSAQGRHPVSERGPSLRHQAAVRGHQLLRDLQSGQRRHRRHRCNAAGGGNRARTAHDRHGLRVRRHRLRHRLRRNDRCTQGHRHPRRWRPLAAREVDRWSAGLSGLGHRGLSEHVLHHRPRQPIRADQCGPLHRNARRLDHEPAFLRGSEGRTTRRSHQQCRRGVGQARLGSGIKDPVPPCEVLVQRLQHRRQTPCLHGLRGRRPRVPQGHRGNRR